MVTASHEMHGDAAVLRLAEVGIEKKQQSWWMHLSDHQQASSYTAVCWRWHALQICQCMVGATCFGSLGVLAAKHWPPMVTDNCDGVGWTSMFGQAGDQAGESLNLY